MALGAVWQGLKLFNESMSAVQRSREAEDEDIYSVDVLLPSSVLARQTTARRPLWYQHCTSDLCGTTVACGC